MIALPDHWCISSCHLCISSITCEFKCIRSLYAARISCCLIKWCDGQRCSCADITAPLSEFSLPSRLQNLRAVRVSHSFSQKIARISRRVEQILSRGTRNCIHSTAKPIPEPYADDRAWIRWHSFHDSKKAGTLPSASNDERNG